MSYSSSQKNLLLSLARRSIRHHLDTGNKLELKEQVEKTFHEKRATFVTLTSGSQLRGCIGHLQAIQPLYFDVIDNAVNAAFGDPRFPPLGKEEFDKIRIEISVLSEPQPLPYANANDLLTKLRPGVDGVIIREGGRSATFLPQVWDDLKRPEDFLSHLCAKAGLDPYEWKTGNLEVMTYQVESFEEGG